MQGSGFRFRSCCPRANRNGYAHLDEDNSFAARQKSGADDIAVSTPMPPTRPKLRETLFFVWVTLSEHKWVTFGERRGAKIYRELREQGHSVSFTAV